MFPTTPATCAMPRVANGVVSLVAHVVGVFLVIGVVIVITTMGQRLFARSGRGGATFISFSLFTVWGRHVVVNIDRRELRRYARALTKCWGSKAAGRALAQA